VVWLPDQTKRKKTAQLSGLLAERVWGKMPELGLEDPELFSAEQIRNLALTKVWAFLFTYSGRKEVSGTFLAL
jgi:hypothetical protein